MGYNAAERGPRFFPRVLYSEGAVPKGTHGRRPAPNPKRRPQRLTANPSPASSAAVAEREDDRQQVLDRPAPARPMPSAPRASASVRRGAVAAVPRRRFSESIGDYAYVAGDLRRIALLALSLVVVLVALSFVVH